MKRTGNGCAPLLLVPTTNGPPLLRPYNCRRLHHPRRSACHQQNGKEQANPLLSTRTTLPQYIVAVLCKPTYARPSEHVFRGDAWLSALTTAVSAQCNPHGARLWMQYTLGVPAKAHGLPKSRGPVHAAVIMPACLLLGCCRESTGLMLDRPPITHAKQQHVAASGRQLQG